MYWKRPSKSIKAGEKVTFRRPFHVCDAGRCMILYRNEQSTANVIVTIIRYIKLDQFFILL